ncbi:uncharacterized protein HMPREF1541_02573 [Cyphellophora europaea CBS 101466]|uniref:Zn(2)-C6 fungal-type domain-containing protein n=1 Tax=Cyphellophora europaea (strain CBS 101466) TaxID=1220924 RepID=W2S675_CYPE1|nr:uncharacterized protein HMPREF1541_02573 [Cyphellophora europaea CBS 101466]ETN43414.1 hypothetical protein HMPREF1541_02573 [Cyphellophora europaea CBS 101466]
MAEQRHEVATANASASESELSDDSQGSRNPKKRKRNQKISCELCKARKVKCDRAEPSCGWCSKNNRICVYQERKKPGMRIAYVHELEDKVNRLEAMLNSLGRRVEEHIHDHDTAVQSKTSATYSQPGYTPLSDISREAVSQNISSPTTDSSWQYSNGQRDSSRLLPEPMSVRSVVDTPDIRSTTRPRSYTASTVATRPYAIGESDLPPYDVVYNLVDLFFKHVNPWSPILDRKTTFNVLFGGARLTEDDRVLLNAIVATTLRFSSDPRLTSASRKQYHDTAKTKVLFHCLENPSIGSMQALVILAIDTIGTSCSLQGMNLLAFLARSITQLGMGNEKTVYLGAPNYTPVSNLHLSHAPQPPSWIEEEGRRRLVWMLYILDRYTTISTSSTFTFPDNDIHLRLPCTYDLFSRNAPVSTRWPRGPSPSNDPLSSSPSHLGSFSYHCEVLTILSRVHNFLSAPLNLSSPAAISHWRATYTSLDHELTAWLHSLPGEYGKISQLCHSDPGSKISNWIMLHAAFVTAVIRLHSVAAYPTISSPHFPPSHNALQRCLGAVESLREIATDTIANSMLDLLGPPFAFSLWTSARLLLVHAATLDCEVDPKIRFFISTLEAMGQYWQIALTYARTLESVVREGTKSSHSMAGKNVANGEGARSFREMRRVAWRTGRGLMGRKEGGWWEQSRVLVPAEGEVEALDVFGFFDYPRVVSEEERVGGSGQGTPVREVAGVQSPVFAMPQREADWLNFQPPHE